MAGKLEHRLETTVDEDLHQLITVRAEHLAGVQPGGKLPYGFRGKAARSLMWDGPEAGELVDAMNRANKVRQARADRK